MQAKVNCQKREQILKVTPWSCLALVTLTDSLIYNLKDLYLCNSERDIGVMCQFYSLLLAYKPEKIIHKEIWPQGLFITTHTLVMFYL